MIDFPTEHPFCVLSHFDVHQLLSLVNLSVRAFHLVTYKIGIYMPYVTKVTAIMAVLCGFLTVSERPVRQLPCEGQQLCAVCRDVANGLHFGVFTCEGCKVIYCCSPVLDTDLYVVIILLV